MINEENEIFLIDCETNQLLVFSTQGHWLRKWGTLGRENGKFFGVFGVVVYKERVYVSDQNRVQIFNRTGKYLFSRIFRIPYNDECNTLYNRYKQKSAGFRNLVKTQVELEFLHS